MWKSLATSGVVVLFGGPIILSSCIAEEGPNGTTQTAEIALRVSVWDDTDSRPVRGRSEVWLRGAGSWYPDLNYGSDVRNFPNRRVRAVDTLLWYPEGRDRTEIPVPVPITNDMCPQGCSRDMVNLTILDSMYTAFAGSMDEVIEVPRSR